MKNRKRILFLVLFAFMVFTCSAEQSFNFDKFLGAWKMQDREINIKIIKERDIYYIIEFITIKHELFFSGDGQRAIFQQWGKGPGGYNCGVQINEGGMSLGYFGVTDTGEWVLSATFLKSAK